MRENEANSYGRVPVQKSYQSRHGHFVHAMLRTDAELILSSTLSQQPVECFNPRPDGVWQFTSPDEGGAQRAPPPYLRNQ